MTALGINNIVTITLRVIEICCVIYVVHESGVINLVENFVVDDKGNICKMLKKKISRIDFKTTMTI